MSGHVLLAVEEASSGLSADDRVLAEHLRSVGTGAGRLGWSGHARFDGAHPPDLD